jgi:hypothetical protein
MGTNGTQTCVDALAVILAGTADAAWREGLRGEDGGSVSSGVRRLFGAFPVDPEAEAMTDRFMAAQYASEGRRPLTRRGREP